MNDHARNGTFFTPRATRSWCDKNFCAIRRSDGGACFIIAMVTFNRLSVSKLPAFPD